MVWDIIFRLLRLIRKHVHGAYTTFGVFLLAGTIIGFAATWGFTELAGHVVSGKTQAFDDAVLQKLASYRRPWLTAAMVEITSLGTGLVVGMTVVITGMFMWLTRHKHSALLLGIATLGGLILNTVLKAGFGRPRPDVVDWGTHAASSSFPSGHAMNSVIVYGTVAYLAARLQPQRSTRVLTLTFAAFIIVLVCGSRLYLGVHYPSDVLAGMAVGLAWAAFCMATLEALQLFARRNAPQMLADEKPAPKDAADSPPVPADSTA